MCGGGRPEARVPRRESTPSLAAGVTTGSSTGGPAGQAKDRQSPLQRDACGHRRAGLASRGRMKRLGSKREKTAGIARSRGTGRPGVLRAKMAGLASLREGRMKGPWCLASNGPSP